MAIVSFASVAVERFFRDGRPNRRAGWAGAAAVALRKLDMLQYAEGLADLASPPGNRRINNQWRIVFRWTESGPAEVDIVDYH